MRTVTTTTVQTGTHTVQDVTVLLVRMTSQQVKSWEWVGDIWGVTAPLYGHEVRDVTGTLLGVILPLGHMARRMHVEWYDPELEDFRSAGETPDAVLTQGVHRILEARNRHVAPVPTGEGFDLDEPRLLPVRVNCYAGVCPTDCADCAADEVAILPGRWA